MTAQRIDGLELDRYLELGGESSHGLNEVLISPLLYRWRIAHGRHDKDRLRVGRAGHTAVLEPHRFADDFVVFHGAVRRGKEWDAFRVEHAARTILTETQHEAAIAIAGAVRAHPVAGPIFADRNGDPEVTITWQHLRTKLPCKARLDWVAAAGDLLVELKTCRDPSPQAFAAQVARLGYHIQLAFYLSAIHALNELVRPQVKLVAVQNVEPYDVVVYDVPPDVLIVGEEKAESALDMIASCRAADTWPGLAVDGEVPLRLPAWAVPKWDDELTVGGEPLFGGEA